MTKASAVASSRNRQLAAAEEDRRSDPLFVNGLARGLRVLRAFDEGHSEMSLSQLAERTGLGKSGVQRLANTLHREGFLDKDEGTRRLRPSHAWLELAYTYCWADPLVGHAMPKLIELSQRLDETINLAEISGDHIIYVARLPCKRTQFAATVVGRRVPALSTSSGRAILATWPEEERRHAIETWPLHAFTPRTTLDRATIGASIEAAAEDGYAITRGQMILNEVGIAAPVRRPDGRAAAAVHCSVSAYTWANAQAERKILPLLIDTANVISPGVR